MQIMLLALAAIAFSAGGLFMKLSEGASRVAPTAAFLALFAAGAIIQAIAMRRSDMSVTYVVVLGLEAVVTVLFAVLLLHENCPPQRIAAIAVVVAGIAWLRVT